MKTREAPHMTKSEARTRKTSPHLADLGDILRWFL